MSDIEEYWTWIATFMLHQIAVYIFQNSLHDILILLSMNDKNDIDFIYNLKR